MQNCKAPLRNILSRNRRTLKPSSLRPLTTTPTRKMSLFQRNFYSPEASFTPLFRLLEDFDQYSRQGNGTTQGGRRTGLAHWQPKFDVRETDSAYELHGELPGMSKENVSIEFTDAQSLLVKGKVERTYTSGTPPAGALEGSSTGGAITDGKEDKSHKTTVEDATEDGTPATAKEGEGEVAKTSEEQKPADSAKYWLTERSVGEFSRTFSFPTRVNQDDVSANFKDGILSITVPKAAKHEPRRITVN